MKYKAIFESGIIYTDDYDEDEVSERLHIDHLRRDLRKNNITTPAVCFDEKNRLVEIFNISA